MAAANVKMHLKRQTCVLNMLDELARQARTQKLKMPPVHAIEEQYERRARRAGVLK